MKNFAIISFIIPFIFSCSTSPRIVVIDNDTDPDGAVNQLELLNSRGSVGLNIFNPETDRAERRRYYESYCSKRWIVENWGDPDESYRKGGIDYFIYKKRDPKAPRYQMQYLSGESPVKLGYKGNILVYIESYFGNKKFFKGENPYILPR